MIRAATALVGMLIVTSAGLLSSTPRARAALAAESLRAVASPPQIVQYIRDRFQVPESVRLTASPLHPSAFSALYQTTIRSSSGKEQQASNIFITKDGRCFVMGDIFLLHGALVPDITHCVREAARLAPAAKVQVSPFRNTVFPDFLEAAVTVQDGGKLRRGKVYVTKDFRTGILGLALPYRRDFTESLMNMKNQPSVGLVNAPVTIVEYADLECPYCARFQEFLDNDFLPKYGSKVRIIFKEFPIQGHDWSFGAEIANECAYQIDPSKFLKYRSLIFANQNSINVANVRERLLSLGEGVGMDRSKLASCLDSRATQGRVEADFREAQNLGIIRLPTCFVNGRIVVGVPPAATFYKIVDEALASASHGYRR